MEIKVLGPGCAKCQQTEKNVKEAVSETGSDAMVEKVKGRVKVPACFHEAYKKFCEAGWLCCIRSVESGGQGMPNSVAQACYEFFQAANYPLIMYPGLTNGAAGLIDRYGTPEQKKKYMERM